MPINIGQPYFPLLSFQQANPVLTGAQVGQQMVSDAIRDQLMKQEVQKQALANQFQQTEQPYEIPADIARYNAIAQTALPEAQADLLKTQLANRLSSNTLGSNINAINAQNEAMVKTALNRAYANIALTNAQSQKDMLQVNRPDLFIKGDPISQSLWLQNVKNQYGEHSPQYQNALQGYNAKLGEQAGKGQYYSTMAQTRPIGLIPSTDRTVDIAYGRGLGYSPEELMKKLTSTNPITGENYTLKDIAQEHGTTLDQVTPQYAPTTSTLSQSQQRKGAESELNAVQDQITNWTAPYSNPVIGGVKLTTDSFSEDPKTQDQVAKYLAGMAVAKELSAIRARAAIGNKIGVESVREMYNSSFGKLPTWLPTRSPETYKSSQEYIKQAIDQMVDSANNSITNVYSKSNSNSQKNTLNYNNIDNYKTINGKNYYQMNGKWYAK